ncbi:PqqC-like protein, partial [Bienertia sinuspersici]
HCWILVIVSLPQGRCIIFPQEQGCIQIQYHMDMCVLTLIMLSKRTHLCQSQLKENAIHQQCNRDTCFVAYTANLDKEGESNKTPTPSFMESQKVANSLRNQDENGDILIKTPLSCDIEAQKVDRSERVVNVDTMLPEMFMFYKCIMKMDYSEQTIIPFDIGITTQSKTVHVGKEEILQFLAHEQIGVCHILMYMTKMYEYASVTGVSSLFGFLCPSGLSLMTQHQKGDVKKVKENKRNRSRYLVDVFKEYGLKGKVFFAPYNDGSHWILCVVDPYNNIVYYLDSLHNQEDIGTGKGVSEDLREIVDIALFQFRTEFEITRKLNMDTKWITIQ